MAAFPLKQDGITTWLVSGAVGPATYYDRAVVHCMQASVVTMLDPQVFIPVTFPKVQACSRNCSRQSRVQKDRHPNVPKDMERFQLQASVCQGQT